MAKSALEPGKVYKVTLGPFGVRNAFSFWIALVEGKKLHHLGYKRADATPLRNRLALGELLFADGPGGLEQFGFIEERTRDFLTRGSLSRIYFDVTNMDSLSGKLGKGRFAFAELKLILENDHLFRIAAFYLRGKHIRATH